MYIAIFSVCAFSAGFLLCALLTNSKVAEYETVIEVAKLINKSQQKRLNELEGK